MTRQIAATLLLLSILGAGTSRADMVTLGASQDNTLYIDVSGAVSNGAGPTMFSGKTGVFGTGARRALVQFNVAGGIPAGATITAVQLRLYMSQSVTGASPIALRRVTNSWGEGISDGGPTGGQGVPAEANDATWIHRFYSGVNWANPGGDFDAASSATINVGGLGTYTWGSTAAMVADVQSWLDAPAGNNGYLLLGNEVVDGSAKRFETRESTSANNRPQLIVTYTPPSVGVESATWSRIKQLDQ